MKVIDNFLIKDYFKEPQNLVYSSSFAWFFQKQTTTFDDDNNFMDVGNRFPIVLTRFSCCLSSLVVFRLKNILKPQNNGI